MASGGWVSKEVQQRTSVKTLLFQGIFYSLPILQGKAWVDHLQEHLFSLWVLLSVFQFFRSPSWPGSRRHFYSSQWWNKLWTSMINTRVKLEVKGSKRCYLLSIMEHGWCLKSSLQSSEDSKDASGTYAVCSTPQRLEPRTGRRSQFEEFGIKNYSEIETVLAESKCYISTERLRINGQNSILFICRLQLGKAVRWKATWGFERHRIFWQTFLLPT